MLLRAVFLVMLGLVAAAPAGADPGQDARFFQVMDQYRLGYSTRDDATMAAHSVCDALDRGASYGQLQTAGLTAPGQRASWTPRDVDQFLFAATSAYCPQYSVLVPRSSLN